MLVSSPSSTADEVYPSTHGKNEVKPPASHPAYITLAASMTISRATDNSQEAACAHSRAINGIVWNHVAYLKCGVFTLKKSRRGSTSCVALNT